MPKPSYSDCVFATQNVLQALADVGEPWCCLVGGMAVKLWGGNHEVSCSHVSLYYDLDILVLSPAVDQRTLQEALVDLEPGNFFLKYPRSRNATFMKLFYRIPNTSYMIKIDLLLSTEPKLEIPRALRSTHFVYLNHLEVAPLYFVLYHKLLGWEDRVDSPEYWKRVKAAQVDYPDIMSLCAIANREGLMPLSKSHMGRLYLDNFRNRADEFVEQYGQSARTRFQWLGFPI